MLFPAFTAQRRTVLAIYGGGLVQGTALILFPAAGPMFTDPTVFALSSSQYGFLFGPQIAAGIVCSLFAARQAARLGMKRVLQAGLVLSVLAMGLMAASQTVVRTPAAFPLLLLAMTSVGAGFGLTISVLNAYAFDLFPERADAAVTALHLMVGLGQVGAALLLGLFVRIGFWWGAPLSVALCVLLLVWLLSTLRMTLAQKHLPEMAAGLGSVPVRIWLFAFAVFLYGTIEGSLGNWSPIFFEQDAGLTKAHAGLSLSIFWGSITMGRFLFVTLSRSISSRLLYRTSPVLIAIGLALLPGVSDTYEALLIMAFLGIAMSFFFPLSISLSSAEWPQGLSAISGIMVASIGLGIGLSSNLLGMLRSSVGLSNLFHSVAGTGVLLLIFVLVLSTTRRGNQGRL